METLTIERDKVEAAAKVSDTAAKVLKFYCNVKYVPRPLYSGGMEYRSNWNEEEFD